jgi:hypothetical protein
MFERFGRAEEHGRDSERHVRDERQLTDASTAFTRSSRSGIVATLIENSRK